MRHFERKSHSSSVYYNGQLVFQGIGPLTKTMMIGFNAALALNQKVASNGKRTSIMSQSLLANQTSKVPTSDLKNNKIKMVGRNPWSLLQISHHVRNLRLLMFRPGQEKVRSRGRSDISWIRDFYFCAFIT